MKKHMYKIVPVALTLLLGCHTKVTAGRTVTFVNKAKTSFLGLLFSPIAPPLKISIIYQGSKYGNNRPYTSQVKMEERGALTSRAKGIGSITVGCTLSVDVRISLPDSRGSSKNYHTFKATATNAKGKTVGTCTFDLVKDPLKPKLLEIPELIPRSVTGKVKWTGSKYEIN